jgi:hypothetical protein
MKALRNLPVAAFVALSTFAAACGDQSATAPHTLVRGASNHQASTKGTGLSLDIVPTVTLPLGLGGTLTVNQAVITNFATVENLAGQIVGVDVTGTLTGTQVDAFGNLVGVTTNPFTANLSVTSSGPGQCTVATLDLSNLTVNGLDIANVTIPANVSVKGSGAVGSLLCNLGNALSSLASGLGGGNVLSGLTNALNNQIGG